MKSILDNISIVLVDTKSPANIGAVARAMMNMGLSRLVLVDPPKDRHAEAAKLAAGADSVLDAAVVFGSLKEAVSDQGLVIGATRHKGRRRKNMHTPREMAEQAVPLLGRNSVSLVFGNEVNGLDNADLALCHELIAIPAAATFASLNLSHAVMIVAYEFFVGAMALWGPDDRVLAPAGDLERFYEQLGTTLLDIGFIDERSAERMMFSLRQLFGRSRLDSREVGIVRGILSAVNATTQKKRNTRDD